MHDTTSPSARREPQWPLSLSWIPFTESYRTRSKLSSRPQVRILYLLSAVVLVLVLGAGLFASRDTPPPPTPSPARPTRSYSPFGDSVYRQEAYYERLEPGTQCRPKNPLSADLPFSYDPVNMARRASLADEAEQVAALFSYPAEDVNKGVKAFIRQMDEGLEKQGTLISQIPSYVTAVPDGTEKVSR
jgi:Hexokinase